MYSGLFCVYVSANIDKNNASHCFTRKIKPLFDLLNPSVHDIYAAGQAENPGG